MTMEDKKYDELEKECGQIKKRRYGKMFHRQLDQMLFFYFRQGYEFAKGEKNEKDK